MRVRWYWRDGGLLGNVLHLPLIQTVSGDVVNLPMISLLGEEAGLSKYIFWHLYPPRCKILVKS